MKKTYLVKKDPTMSGNDNWIIMNGYEFTRFMETPEGQSRKNNFARLDSCGDGDDLLIVECGQDKARVWRAENDKHDYLKECEEKSGYTIVSYSSFSTEDEELTGEEVLRDDNCDVEAQVIEQIHLAELGRAIRELSPIHQKIIKGLFLASPTLTEKELANQLGISQQCVNYYKKRSLLELKKFLGN